tara:strand:+ start:1419 stop:2252 length:834 start_codon:yes stop_codon:yes gene_type:complete
MTKVLKPKVINGIKSYSPGVANTYNDYPDDFETTNNNVQHSFWVRSRNRLFSWFVKKECKRFDKVNYLDIGCATGDFIKHIKKDNKLTITGSEVYMGGLLLASKNLPEIDFIQFDVTEGVLGKQFNVITAFDVLEHIDNDEISMDHIAKMLTDDGVFILSVPQHMFLWSKLDEIVFHKRRYSRTEMLRKLRKNGLEPVRVTSHVFSLFPFMVLSRILGSFKSDTSGDALKDHVEFSKPLNWIFDKVMRLDELLIKLGLNLPFGGTLVVVARKDKNQN